MLETPADATNVTDAEVTDAAKADASGAMRGL
jgi:hypothetical protein